jgi:hypothetical protein
MSQLSNDKHKEYARYASHCLELVPTTKDPGARSIQLDMAVEWMRLADEFLHSVGR